MLSSFMDQFMYPMQYKIQDALDELEDTFTKDDSGFIYVDGEEGDWGDILCYQGKELVYTHKIYSGDSEEIILTEFGKSLVKLIILDTITKHLFD